MSESWEEDILDDADSSDSAVKEPQIFRLGRDTAADRLDKLLAKLLPEHSRARLQTWIEDGFVTVNQKAAKVRQIVGPGDVISVIEQASEQSKAFVPEPVEFGVVAESSAWIVVNKPAGLVTHPGAGNWHGTLLNGLLYRYPELAVVPRAGIVHRLDKDTSGLLVVARTETAQTHLVRQLQARTMGRRYLALAQGEMLDEGAVDLPIGRDPRVPVRMSVDRPIAPKPALTHYACLRVGNYQDKRQEKRVSLVECRLETGRTHQIRVHMSYLGHPLLGDSLYGSHIAVGRQMLHAYQLRFVNPESEQEVMFEAELPSDMQAVIDIVQWD
ncbi:RluA family pseudouridine synthase [Pelistega europaea]|uniref:Pseudouridine synthase n=1 Tax=Pelistega europaea TaxID=106147 RepID=A0A7Y4P636_9BURK|nr:RluA family pseudouridine synthase [Pelistega europaea]